MSEIQYSLGENGEGTQLPKATDDGIKRVAKQLEAARKIRLGDNTFSLDGDFSTGLDGINVIPFEQTKEPMGISIEGLNGTRVNTNNQIDIDFVKGPFKDFLETPDSSIRLQDYYIVNGNRMSEENYKKYVEWKKSKSEGNN